VLFIVGLKGLTHPRTAVRGNLLGAVGMLLAILVTLIDKSIVSYWLILLGVAIGSGVGAWLAVTTQMTAMPQMVALLNGFGGGASVFVAWAASLEAQLHETSFTPDVAAAIALTVLIGAVTFWGSLLAWAKLEERLSDKASRFPNQ
jgi:NAD(P) transhydrogenase subunit beta